MPALVLSAPGLAPRALLTALLVAACVTDVRARRIPNALVVTLLGTAFIRVALSAWTGPVAGFAGGLGDVALGALAGFALWIPLYAVGVLGAGDVKLFAAAAAWIGPAAVPGAALNAALAGGVLGLLWFAARRVAALAPAAGRARVPYGVAIAAGVLASVWVAP